MLEFMIILAAWIAPGVLLFLYLLWLSKRKDGSGGGVHASASLPVGSPIAENDRSAAEPAQLIAPARTREKAGG